MAKRQRCLDPLSGDQFVDFTFRQLIVILDEIIDIIRVKSDLRDPDDPREGLWGLLTEDNKIFLEANASSKTILHYFIHELAHALYHEKMKERAIRQVTRILCKRLTEDQKKILKRYLPRHRVKRGPKESEDKN